MTFDETRYGRGSDDGDEFGDNEPFDDVVDDEEEEELEDEDEMNNCSTCAANLKILDLQPPASEGEIKNAYRDMAKVWHPDRFQGDSRLSAKAEEKFKCIQNAHQESHEACRHSFSICDESPRGAAFEKHRRMSRAR